MEEFTLLEYTLTPHSMVPLPNHKIYKFEQIKICV